MILLTWFLLILIWISISSVLYVLHKRNREFKNRIIKKIQQSVEANDGE
jgi:hypothetical protein